MSSALLQQSVSRGHLQSGDSSACGCTTWACRLWPTLWTLFPECCTRRVENI